MNRSTAATLLTVALAGLLTACTETDNRFSTSYACRFMFNAQLHATSILTRVLDNPGMFARVKVEKRSGIVHLLVSPNTKDAEEDIALTTEEESRVYQTINVGANQSIFIGCNTTGEWRAYDAQCPWCLENYSGNNYPLTWTSGSVVECARCKRTYNLNYDGISTDGSRMLQYKVRSNGTVITVTNT